MAAGPSKKNQEAQNPLILRCHRLMESFAKSDDERDFYLDRREGFILYANLDKTEEEIEALENELKQYSDRYCLIPKLTFFETKKLMEGFVNEKVYDIDTKEKLLDIIQSKEAREHFLEFIYDHHSELEKWQQFYQERSRIRIIEWLREQNFNFVFEEDLELPTNLIEGLKEHLFEPKVNKELESARKTLFSKAKSYYSNEALNPRPKRGRPPKQVQKLEHEHQVTTDIYTTVPAPLMPFLFKPDISSALDVTFSSKFGSGKELLAHGKHLAEFSGLDENLGDIGQKLAALRQISHRWAEQEKETQGTQGTKSQKEKLQRIDFEEDDEDDEDDEEEDIIFKSKKPSSKAIPVSKDKKKPAAIKKLNGDTPKKSPPTASKKSEGIQQDLKKTKPSSPPKRLLRKTTKKKLKS